MTTKNRISIIVLNYNGLHYLGKCLTSLERLHYPQEKYDIVVVDNASTDDSVLFVETHYPAVRIIKNKKNYGFCQANNIAIKTCTTPYILLLNNDLHVHKNFLKELVTVMDKYPSCACCGGEEYGYDEYIPTPQGKIRETNWIGAGATIYRTEALYQSGLFDPYFFMNCEDVDISWRLKLKGWKIFQNEKAIFYHAGKGKPVQITDKIFFLAWRNRIFLLIKYASVSQIFQSFYKYGSLLIRQKKISPSSLPVTSAPQKPKRVYKKYYLKGYFITKLFFTILYHLPLMLKERARLKKWITHPKEVDSWIQYVDRTTLSSQ